MHGLHRIYLPTTRRVALTKHASFDEAKIRFSQNISSRTNNDIEVNPSDVEGKKVTNDSKATLQNKQKPPNPVTLSDEKRSTEGVEKLDEEEVWRTTPGQEVPRRSTPCIRKPSKTLSIKLLPRSCKEDEPSVKEGLGGKLGKMKKKRKT